MKEWIIHLVESFESKKTVCGKDVKDFDKYYIAVERIECDALTCRTWIYTCIDCKAKIQEMDK